MELAWRSHTKALPAESTVRNVLARWYEPATLDLLKDSPINCLLVTWSAPVDAAIDVEQQRLVKNYAEAAHKRGLAVLGLMYAPGDISKIAADATKASLDGLVLDGDFSSEYAPALRKAATPISIVEIAKEAGAYRWRSESLVALTGVPPSGRNLAEMGIRGAPSSQPWIESNGWLVRSLATSSSQRQVWISSQTENPSSIDYARAVADTAIAGGHWIISLDDAIRAKLLSQDPSALELWQRLLKYVKFAENSAEWRTLPPFGSVGIVLDPASTQSDIDDEYLKLAVRRQVPYQMIPRPELNAAGLAKFRALVAIALDPPSAAEHKILEEFANNGGLVIAGPSWGDAPKNEPFVEIPTGKGRLVVYKDPDPESVAHDLKELLSDDELGIVPFNVPSVITMASGGAPGQQLVVQLLNYFDHPVEMITLRVAGKLRSARMESPEGTTIDLSLRDTDGGTEVTIPKLSLWAAVSMQ